MTNEVSTDVMSLFSDNAPIVQIAKPPTEWLPTLSIVYGVSTDALAAGCQLGHWALKNSIDLGTGVKAVCFEYCIKAAVFNSVTKKYTSDIRVPSSIGSVIECYAYQKFYHQALPAGMNMEEMKELLFWLPEQNLFAVATFKKSTYQFADEIINASKRSGGRVCLLGLTMIKNPNNGNTRAQISITPMAESMAQGTVKVPSDFIADALKRFVPPVPEQAPDLPFDR